LERVTPRRAPTGPDRPTRPGQSRRGPLPGERAVPVFRGAERREAHLLDHLPRAPGRHPAGQGNAARSARVATDGSVARHTAATTATPAAPARASDPAVAAVMPPTPMTGTPAGAGGAGTDTRAPAPHAGGGGAPRAPRRPPRRHRGDARDRWQARARQTRASARERAGGWRGGGGRGAAAPPTREGAATAVAKK